jgi:fructose-bisphosphate aldolase class I
VPPFLVSPGLLQKAYGARDERALRLGVAAQGVVLLAFAIVPTLLGLVARIYRPDLANPEFAVPVVLTEGLPPLLGAFGLAAVFSAELSTADAILFMLATSLSQDLYKRYARPGAGDGEVLRVARGAAVAGGLFGVLLAIAIPTVIDSLTLFYSVLGVTLFVPIAAGLYSRRPGVPEALAAIGVGMAVLFAAQLAGLARVSRIFEPSLLAIAASGLAFGGVFLVRHRRRAAPPSQRPNDLPHCTRSSGTLAHRPDGGIAVSTFTEQMEKIRTAPGFIAALDQSGGSTPKALKQYGVPENAWKDEAEMFDLIHAMRTRLITSPAFDGDRILGAILFEGTMDRDIDGVPAPTYLWGRKRVVPFVKVDKGLADAKDGVQLMKPMPDLDQLLERAKAKGVFGTKMRSLIKDANSDGIAAVVRQQFEAARKILAKGLVPILEPEVDIKCPDKKRAEELLRKELLEELDRLDAGQSVMLKLTIPDVDDFYLPLIEHPRVLKVVALSGGYSREEANERLARNHGMVASFSRALVEGLSAQQSEDEFRTALDASIESIFRASMT